MTDMRASGSSFLSRHPLDHGPEPLIRAIERNMAKPSDTMESSCARIREFVATMNRPLTPGSIALFEQVWEIMDDYPGFSPVKTMLSPNHRVLTTWYRYDWMSKRMIERTLFVRLNNLAQLDAVATQLTRPHGYPSVDGVQTFRMFDPNRSHFTKYWFHSVDTKVCQLYHSSFVVRGDIAMTYGVCLVAPFVRR